MTTKADLRALARARRKQLQVADIGGAERCAAHAADMMAALCLDGSPVVALYRAMGSEIDTDPLARALLTAGCRLCLPCVETPDAPLVFRAWKPGDELRLDLVGAASPAPEAPEITPDLIVTPLVAFDAFGGRLGQGGGYYDRTFEALPGARRVGLAWSDQQVDRIPVEAHDIDLHGVLTDMGYMAARKGD